MRVAAVQLADDGSAAEITAALVAAVDEALEAGATLIVCPYVARLSDEDEAAVAVKSAIKKAAAATVVLPCGGLAYGGAHLRDEAAADAPGAIGVMSGDECLDPDALAVMAQGCPEILVWQLEGESPLQVEAIREYAIAASETVAGLVVVASLTGSGTGAGGALICWGGEIVAEAGELPEVLAADVVTPLLPPDLRGERTIAPTILLQRLAVHRGEKLAPDYPAEDD